MKNVLLICFVIIGLFSFAAMAEVNYDYLITLQDDWGLFGMFTKATTTPDVNHRGHNTIAADSNNIIYEIPAKWNRIRLRCSTLAIADLNDVNDVNAVMDIFFMNGTEDNFNRIATLKFTAGAQCRAVDPNYLFADTLAETNHNWPGVADPNNVRLTNPGGDYIAEYFVDVRGSKKMAISPTTITRTRTAKIEITGY